MSEVREGSSAHSHLGCQLQGELVSEAIFIKIKMHLHFGWSESSGRRVWYFSLECEEDEEGEILAGIKQIHAVHLSFHMVTL